MATPSDPYLDWPYAARYVLDTLDPKLIESHATAALARALNIGRMVAFVGAGVSMSYGRISWKALVDTEFQRVQARYKKYIEENVQETKEYHGKADTNISLVDNHIRRLHDAMMLLDPQRQDVKSDRYPMVFQLCEQLDQAIQEGESKRPPRVGQKSGKDKALGIRAHAMALTVDELGHARQILWEALQGLPPNVLRTDFDTSPTSSSGTPSIRDIIDNNLPALLRERGQHESDGIAIAWFYSNSTLTRLIGQTRKYLIGDIPQIWGNRLISVLEQHISASTARDDPDPVINRQPLIPTRRYLFGALLHLVPPRRRLAILKSIRNPKELYGPLARNQVIPQLRDPLLLLLERLQINRFLTTNYDHEIDRLFISQRFEPSSPPIASSSAKEAGTMRPSFRTTILKNVDAGEMIAFAAQDRSRAGHVVHLHGRAEHDGLGHITVTESDYQDHYLRVDDYRDLADDAIRLAFGANPILFVGSNMGEDDILRPLRQFMSSPARIGERVSIALIPGKYDRRYCTEEKTALLGRFGVYAIHFGNAKVMPEGIPLPASRDERDEKSVFWLPWILNIIKYLTDFLTKLERHSQRNDSAAVRTPTGFDQIQSAWDPIMRLIPTSATDTLSDEGLCRSLVEGWSPLTAKQIITEGLVNLSPPGEIPRLVPPTLIEGIESKPGDHVDLRLEVGLINDALAFSYAIEQGGLRGLISNAAIPRLSRAYATALRGAGDAILATFTCARLIRARWDWDEWRQQWHKVPDPRSTVALVRRQGLRAGTRPDTAGTDATHASKYLTKTFSIIDSHSLSVARRDRRKPKFGRFYDGAPSQSVYALLSALRSTEAASFLNTAKRRILLLVTRRGVGKGHFFAALQTFGAREFLDELLNALAGNADNAPDAPQQVKWHGIAFFNLSFTHDVMSMFDRISEFLFDRLSTFLEFQSPGVGEPQLETGAHELRRQWMSLQNDRRERLAFILKEWSNFHENTKGPLKPRVLIAINSLDVLFDESGRPKNGEIKSIMDTLLSKTVTGSPLDFVLISDESRVPDYFRRPAEIDADRTFVGEAADPRHVRRESDPGPSSDEIKRIEALLLHRRPIDADGEVSDQRRAVDLNISDRIGGLFRVHFVHTARTSIFVSFYFPRIAILMARSVLLEASVLPPGSVASDALSSLGYPGAFSNNFADDEISNKLHDELSRLRRKAVVPPKDFIPVIMMGLAVALELLRDPDRMKAALPFELPTKTTKRDAERKITRQLAGRMARFVQDAAATMLPPHTDVLGPHDPADVSGHSLSRFRMCQIVVGMLDREFPGPRQGTIPVDRFADAVNQFDALFRNVHLTTTSRFGSTLLMAGAYEIAGALSGEPHAPLGMVSLENVDRATKQLRRFLDRVDYELKGVPSRNRTSTIIEHVMRLMSRHHARSERLPLTLKLLRNPDVAATEPWVGTSKATPEMFNLLTEILWHLAIVGQPVEFDVLAMCPRITDAADLLFEALHPPKQTAQENASKPSGDEPSHPPEQEFRLGSAERTACRHKMIGETLALGINRCLIFPLQPTGTPSAGSSFTVPLPEDWPPRYTLHRLMQRYVLQQIGAPDVEYSEMSRFGISLFASQPNELPRLRPEAHTRVRRTIASLIGYPGDVGELQEDFYTARPIVRARMLRAAYGIMRSVYSVAVLARLDVPSQSPTQEDPDIGYMEQYRRLVRWTIKASNDLQSDLAQDVKQLQTRGDARPASEKTDAPSPSYDVEHFRPFFSEEIVWLYNECGVLSLVQGHLSDAHALFGRALEAAGRLEPDSSRPLHVRIQLNKAIVDIERGHTEEARRNLSRIRAIRGEHFIPRALATGYLGLIEHLAGNGDVATDLYNSAIEELIKERRTRAASIFARHLGDLRRIMGGDKREEAKARIEQALNLAEEGSHEDVRHMALLAHARLRIDTYSHANAHTVHGDLDQVEKYGRTIGLPRLLCEALALRARLLLKQGETHLASSLAAQSLEIAASNNMRIRTLSALLLLAEICIERDQRRAARPLIELAARLARSSRCHFALRHTQDLSSQLAHGSSN